MKKASIMKRAKTDSTERGLRRNPVITSLEKSRPHAGDGVRRNAGCDAGWQDRAKPRVDLAVKTGLFHYAAWGRTKYDGQVHGVPIRRQVERSKTSILAAYPAWRFNSRSFFSQNVYLDDNPVRIDSFSFVTGPPLSWTQYSSPFFLLLNNC